MTLDQCMHCKHKIIESYTWGKSVGFYRISLLCDLTVEYPNYSGEATPNMLWRAPKDNCEKFETE